MKWLALAMVLTALPALGPSRRLEVPGVRQAPQRCGPAALEMVLAYYGADSAARAEAERAYDPALGGTLITDLAAAAARAGYQAEVATLGDSAILELLAQGVPPILLFQNGRGPITVRHFGVVVGWDSVGEAFTLQDGGPHPRRIRRAELVGRWRTAGSQALIVRRRAP